MSKGQATRSTIRQKNNIWLVVVYMVVNLDLEIPWQFVFSESQTGLGLWSYQFAVVSSPHFSRNHEVPMNNLSNSIVSPHLILLCDLAIFIIIGGCFLFNRTERYDGCNSWRVASI